MKKGLFALVAGYIGGIALAMKYRKDNGQSKLPKDTSKSTVDSLIEEVADIHKTAYKEVKGFITTNFGEIKDFESLKTKINEMIDEYTEEITVRMDELKDGGDDKKKEIILAIDTMYEEKSALIDELKGKGLSFADTTYEKISDWLDEAKAKLDKVHDKVLAKVK